MVKGSREKTQDQRAIKNAFLIEYLRKNPDKRYSSLLSQVSPPSASASTLDSMSSNSIPNDLKTYIPPFPPPNYPPPPPPTKEEQAISTLTNMNSGPDANDYGAASILTNMNKGHNDDIYHTATALTRIRTEKGGKSNKNKSKKNRNTKKNRKSKKNRK